MCTIVCKLSGVPIVSSSVDHIVFLSDMFTLDIVSTAVLNNNGLTSLILIEPKALAEQGDPEL